MKATQPDSQTEVDYSVGYNRAIDWYYEPDNIANHQRFTLTEDFLRKHRPEINILKFVNILFKQLDFIKENKTSVERVLSHLRQLQLMEIPHLTLYALIILWLGTGDPRENAIGRRLKVEIESAEGSTPEKTIAGANFDPNVTRGELQEKIRVLEQINKGQQALNEQLINLPRATQKSESLFSDYSVREHVLIFKYFLEANKVNEGRINYSHKTIAEFIILIFGVAPPKNIFGSDYYKWVKEGEPRISQNLIDSKHKVCLLFSRVGMKSIVDKIKADIFSSQADLNITISGNKVTNT